MKTYMRLLVIGLASVVILSCIPGPGPAPTVTPVPKTEAPPKPTPGPDEPPDPTPDPDDTQIRQNLLRSTVQIVALDDTTNGLQPMWSGSGTILSPDGLILTNAHVAGDADPAYQPDALGIAITIRSDEPPEPTYLAEVLAIDYALDLAVIKISQDLDGRPIDSDQLNLTYVAVGDSDVLELGDLVQILGYPGIGGETITFTEGVVSGFTRERNVDGRAWVKTDATIAGGNSGGLAATKGGNIIGVPTQVGYGGAERFADCRYLADTNGDGVINEDDNCIPVGGFINALRPVNLAKPLIEAARTGIAPKPGPGPGPGPQPSGDARFYNLVFGPDVTKNDQPTQVVTQLPSGATGLYAFWDYEGMGGGVSWEARWYRDGQYLENVSWPAAPWQGDVQGSWWVGVTNDEGLTDGTYDVELYVEDELLARGSIPVGGSVSGPTITNLRFSDSENNDQPANPYLLPSGITSAYAFFDYSGMSDGMSWGRVWYYEGEEVATGSSTWDEGSSGTTHASLSAQGPLAPGTYRLEVTVEGTLAAASNFAVAGTQDQGAISNFTFASGVDAQGNPVNPGMSFPAGITELYFFFDYAGLQDGMAFNIRWLLDNEEILSYDETWAWGGSGTFYDYIYRTGGEALPDGQYTVELTIEGQLVQQGSATVGTGVGPTPIPDPTGGLYIQGYVYDADTGQGIPGALFVVLNPGITIEGWDGSVEQIFTSAETDANGYFELPVPLERGQSYSMFIWAEGYRLNGGDDIPIGDEPSPFEMEIELQRE
jgi:S1-C subfamily serine protease